MNGVQQPAFDCYVPPLRLKKSDLTVPPSHKEKAKHPYQLSPCEVRNTFRLNKRQKLAKIARSFTKGFVDGARVGWKVGALFGGGTMAAINIAGSLAMPVSILGIGVAVALGALKGAVIGSLVFGGVYGVYRMACSACHLIRKSPERLVQEQAAKGRKIITELTDKHIHGKKLSDAEQKDLRYYQERVPVWQKTSNYYQGYLQLKDGEERPVETTELCQLPDDLEEV